MKSATAMSLGHQFGSNNNNDDNNSNNNRLCTVICLLGLTLSLGLIRCSAEIASQPLWRDHVFSEPSSVVLPCRAGELCVLDCPPRTAVLLVGLMKDWERHVAHILESIAKPCNADIFIHTSGMPLKLVARLGSSLKGWKDEYNKNNNIRKEKQTMQFWHLQRAWKLMLAHEHSSGFTYDVVVKARSDVVPLPPAHLTFAGWREGGRLHMMTDYLFWAKRADFEKISDQFTSIRRYMPGGQYQDPYKRPIAVEKLLQSLKVDPWVNRGTSSETWELYQKIQTLPYPDMGRAGAIPNLEAAMEQGLHFIPMTDGQTCKVHCGDICLPNGFLKGGWHSEKDLLDYALIQDIMICDVGANVTQVMFKGRVVARMLARDRS
ncbi:unnamed protein product [Polarella glacialis]|uniref:Uncharacterized protein n=1 Tax=Polarella glacialis TaxID=89957 RepID=A0A813IXH6_POLGL|nr:unnamed protein product [Polarella glacialis]